MTYSLEDFQDLNGTGFQGGGEGQQTDPKDEFFHSVYIAGKSRTNEVGITEKSGHLQVRGVTYNQKEVHMIITHTKDILAKIERENGRNETKCFSYKEGQYPWKGTTFLQNGEQRICPQTSSERAANSFCKACRVQLIVAGLYCDENGSPILSEDGKPIYVFIRGQKTKYQAVSEYLNDLYKEELDPIFTPVTPETKLFEKANVNNKRFITKISIGKYQTSHGSEVDIFKLDRLSELPKDAVMKILKMSKNTLEKFTEKMDWSKKKGAVKKHAGILEIGESVSEPEETPFTEDAPKKQEPKKFSLDDIEI